MNNQLIIKIIWKIIANENNHQLQPFYKCIKSLSAIRNLRMLNYSLYSMFLSDKDR